MENKKKNRGVAFWIVTVLCIITLIISVIVSCINKNNLILGGCLFGASILLWLCMIVLNETGKHK